MTARNGSSEGPDPRIPRAGARATVAVGVTALVAAAIALLAAAGDKGLAFFTRDPSAAVDKAGVCTGSQCAAAGLQSNIGLLVLWGAAVLTLAAVALVRRRRSDWAPSCSRAGC